MSSASASCIWKAAVEMEQVEMPDYPPEQGKGGDWLVSSLFSWVRLPRPLGLREVITVMETSAAALLRIPMGPKSFHFIPKDNFYFFFLRDL